MDPLSITASIIAVLQATNAVVSVCYDYRSAIKNSSWELPKIIDEVRGLRNVLETLEQLAKQAERPNSAATSRLPSLRLLCDPGNGLMAKCQVELSDLEKQLAPPSWGGPAGSRRRALIQASGWPLKKGAVEKALFNIGRLKGTLSLAITADEAKLMMAIQDTSKDIQKTTVNVQKILKTLHETFTRKATDDRCSRIYEWLVAPDPSSDYNKARQLCYAKTGSWFLQSKEYATWKTNKGSFLWLHGIPGCGKTILTSTVAEDVINQCQHGSSGEPSPSMLLQFYFDFNDSEKQDHEKMIRSLIMQLSAHSDLMPEALESMYASCIYGQRQPTAEALLECLRELLQGFETVFLILDALDECTNRHDLLLTVEQIVQWQMGLQILVTSRREADIGDYFDQIAMTKVNIQSALVNNDIRAYVRSRLQNDWKLKRWRKQAAVRDEIEMILMSKAGGMFRWAACQLDALGRCLTVPMLRKALQSLPATLDEIYSRILDNVDEAWSQSVAQILEWLVFSTVPLRLTEVAELVAVNIEEDPPFDPNRRLSDPRDVITMCSSLVTMTKLKARSNDSKLTRYDGANSEPIDYENFTLEYASNEDSGDDNISDDDSRIIVRLAHFSVKEYLTSRQLRIGPTRPKRILEIPANASLAETCLAYLLYFDKPDYLTPQTMNHFPLLGYAARNWLKHARIAEEYSSRLISLIMNLFLRQGDVYRNWIRIFDPERTLEAPLAWQLAVQPRSPLYYACLAGLLKPAKLLVENGANINLPEGDLGYPLLAAIENNHEDVARYLIDSGADVGVSAPDWPVGMTALHRAARYGHESLAGRLLNCGAMVNAKTDAKTTPLHMAVEYEHSEIARLLLEHGADIEAKDSVGQTSLYIAVSNGDTTLTELLLNHGANIEERDGLGRTVLFAAIEHLHLDISRLLLRKGAGVQVMDKRGQTLLHCAAASGYTATVEQVFQDIEAADNFGRTALHIAADAGHDNAVTLLLDQGANIEARSNGGQTPLYYASTAGHAVVVQTLLDRGARIKVYDKYGGSLLYAVAHAGEAAEPVLSIILEEWEQHSKCGRTLLHHAAAAGDTAMVELLIQRSVELDTKTAAGETALYLAMINGFDDIVQLLRKAQRDNILDRASGNVWLEDDDG